MAHNDSNILDYLYSLIPGVLRCGSTLYTHPLELSKVRLQNHTFIDSNPISRLKWSIIDLKHSGISGLYRGYSMTLISMAFKTIYKYPLLIFGPQKIAQLSKGSFHDHPILYQTALAPFIVSVDTIMQGPIRRIKFIAMNSASASASAPTGSHHIYHIVKGLYQNRLTGEGFWYGSRAYAIKHGFGSCSLLLTDALIRESFLKRDLVIGYQNPLYVGASAANGIFLAMVSTPLDVISTKMGSKINSGPFSSPAPKVGYIVTVKSIYSKEGFHGFTKGFTIRVLNRTGSAMYTSLVISWGRKELL